MPTIELACFIVTAVLVALILVAAGGLVYTVAYHRGWEDGFGDCAEIDDDADFCPDEMNHA